MQVEPGPRSPFSDLDRPPLAVEALRRSLLRDGSTWSQVDVVQSAGSTNHELADAATAERARPGAVLIAELQTSGRGRLQRSWESPARAGLTFSLLLAPTRPVNEWGWLPLIVGLAVVRGVEESAGIAATLKWPNDVLAADGRKLAGILAERVDVAGHAQAVVGVGINVTTRAAELPSGAATSLLLAGAEHTDRQHVLLAVLRRLDDLIVDWEGGRELAEDYRAACSTLGERVSVTRAGLVPLLGTATGIEADGRLVVTDAEGTQTRLSAGDVVHLR